MPQNPSVVHTHTSKKSVACAYCRPHKLSSVFCKKNAKKLAPTCSHNGQDQKIKRVYLAQRPPRTRAYFRLHHAAHFLCYGHSFILPAHGNYTTAAHLGGFPFRAVPCKINRYRSIPHKNRFHFPPTTAFRSSASFRPKAARNFKAYSPQQFPPLLRRSLLLFIPYCHKMQTQTPN